MVNSETNTSFNRTASASGTEKPIILAVDDRPELLTTITEMLEEHYKVMGAISGRIALKIINKFEPTLFLLDIEMPEMNGYELAEAIRAHDKFKDAPIIFLTGKKADDETLALINKLGDDYIIKPVSNDLLTEKVSRYLH